MSPSPQLSSSDSAYAQRRKQHLALINQLRAIGAQADLDLPRIAVIGNQSAGKSSLVEAISGISVPRDAGTCTRCPMECRLSHSSGGWGCQVSIRWEFKEDGARQDEVCEVPFGPAITSKADVEAVLRRAQTAVLNPSRPLSDFLLTDVNKLQNMGSKQLKFSRNTVCVNLQGPEFTELAFVDLPGIIQNAESETVKLVEDLVLSHIRGNCIILVTLPMSDDIENQKAMRLAKQVDPIGTRTIGVLTKPDTLTTGAIKARNLWLDVIEGRRFSLRHGYYCTRQPDDEERSKGISAEEARRVEKDFFLRISPWSKSSQQYRFGTHNLINNISTLLSQLIDEKLPSMQLEVDNQLDKCMKRLAELPAPITSDPSSYILSLVTSFCSSVRLNVHGDPHSAELVQATRKIYGSFKHDIRSSAPEFLPFVDKQDIPADVAKYLNLDEDDEDDEDMPIENRGPKPHNYIFLQDVKNHIQRSLTRELPNNIPYPAKTVLIQSSQGTWSSDSRRCFDEVHKKLKGTLHELIDDQFSRYEHLRSRLKPVVTELIDARHKETWHDIEKMLKRESLPYTQNGHYYQVTKEKYLAKYKDARAGHVVLERPQKRQKLNGGETAQASPSVPATEQQKTAAGRRGPRHSVATSNQPVSDSPTIPTDISSGSPPAPQRAPEPTADVPQSNKRSLPVDDEQRAAVERRVLAGLAELGYNCSVVDLGKLVPPDIYEQEMDVMAEVRAYFHVPYKRVIDNIPMTIDHTFLFSFSELLQSFLIEKLALGTADSASRCAKYLSEDPGVVAEREELLSKKKRLDSIRTELVNFGVV
ncbi:hypothetical protein QCA50_020450 [Cerrena zonata]|uniref:Uncharacterized protein n=1 Tax=Cerrena zonata TaxID=2478898 RepID=A0AAW0FBP9_9APHY